MKLLRFYVRQHLLLHDLDVRFDRPGRLDTGQYALDFLVGVNGSGKSTFLRALTQVFANLRTDQPNSFDFTLEYMLGEKDTAQYVSIGRETHNTHATQTMTVKSGDDIIYQSESIDIRYLPRRVIVYSTGNEAELARLLTSSKDEPGAEDASDGLLKDSVQRAIRELPGSMAEVREFLADGSGEPPFWLMCNTRLPIITLCGLLAHLMSENQTLNDVIEAIGVQSISGFSLRFRLHTAISDNDIYNRLAKYATRRLHLGTDYLLHFDLSDQPKFIIWELFGEFNGSFELYRTLDILSTDNPDTGQPTLQQVSIFLQRKSPLKTNDNLPGSNSVPNLFLLNWLSDGEQSFLGRMALLAMLDADDSLILLDEPEVHFNDYWKREVVDLLDTVMSQHTNHLLITTHSSILLSDVTEGNVTVLVKGADGWSQQQFLRIPLLAVDPSEIMVNYFGTGRSVGKRSTRLLSDAVQRGDIAELEKLLTMVGPGYWRYRLQARLEELRATSS